MKVIDLLNKMANGELKDKAVVIFKSHECSTIFHKKDSRFEFSEKGDWNNYFYGIDIKELNDEVEIIEEPKEELEEIELIDIHYINGKCIFKVYGQSIDETIAIKVNELIDEVNKLKKERMNNEQCKYNWKHN